MTAEDREAERVGLKIITKISRTAVQLDQYHTPKSVLSMHGVLNPCMLTLAQHQKLGRLSPIHTNNTYVHTRTVAVANECIRQTSKAGEWVHTRTSETSTKMGRHCGVHLTLVHLYAMYRRSRQWNTSHFYLLHIYVHRSNSGKLKSEVLPIQTKSNHASTFSYSPPAYFQFTTFQMLVR